MLGLFSLKITNIFHKFSLGPCELSLSVISKITSWDVHFILRCHCTLRPLTLNTQHLLLESWICTVIRFSFSVSYSSIFNSISDRHQNRHYLLIWLSSILFFLKAGTFILCPSQIFLKKYTFLTLEDEAFWCNLNIFSIFHGLVHFSLSHPTLLKTCFAKGDRSQAFLYIECLVPLALAFLICKALPSILAAVFYTDRLCFLF